MALSRTEEARQARLRWKLRGGDLKGPWPGVLVCVLLTLLAAKVAKLPCPPFTLATGQHPISGVLLALLFGMLLRNLWSGSTAFKPGADLAVKRILPYGIILLGAELNFYNIIRLGLQAMVAAVAVIAAAIGLTQVFGRLLRIGSRLGLLIGVGTAICGSSAIVATAPVIEASDEDLAYAITTINLFGMVAMIAFPAIAVILQMSATTYGAWCGLAIHATPQVVAAGFAHYLDGRTAGEIATIVKLTRVSLLGPTVFAIGALYGWRRSRQERGAGRRVNYLKLIPTFVLWFLVVALLNTFGFLPKLTLHFTDAYPWGAGDLVVDTAKQVYAAANWIITGAMAGVGLSTDLRAMRGVGLKPLLLGLLAAVIIAVASLMGAGVAVEGGWH